MQSRREKMVQTTLVGVQCHCRAHAVDGLLRCCPASIRQSKERSPVVGSWKGLGAHTAACLQRATQHTGVNVLGCCRSHHTVSQADSLLGHSDHEGGTVSDGCHVWAKIWKGMKACRRAGFEGLQWAESTQQHGQRREVSGHSLHCRHPLAHRHCSQPLPTSSVLVPACRHTGLLNSTRTPRVSVSIMSLLDVMSCELQSGGNPSNCSGLLVAGMKNRHITRTPFCVNVCCTAGLCCRWCSRRDHVGRCGAGEVG